jgi:hypothetical protein
MPSRTFNPDLLSLANEVHDLRRAGAFDSRTSRSVTVLIRRYPRCPQILLAVAEYTELRYLSQDSKLPNYQVAVLERRYRDILKLDSRYARAWENLAAILDIDNRLDEAETAARKAVRYGNEPRRRRPARSHPRTTGQRHRSPPPRPTPARRQRPIRLGTQHRRRRPARRMATLQCLRTT